ncbi:hypothetical protein K435DRAFT_808708 [Dendrothele bispora CBS 962.96]|uniref:Mug135-like C-terminal domain-containing protein n=1 Tax=Dendrothele bispora (strain CBS 962.96) TaxID=1314807 RepID=A0A4S8L0J0_DENBC|nr:hypothetical protein K435DRAFT_808708 [Dendrothele bispora CBS 962.96]
MNRRYSLWFVPAVEAAIEATIGPAVEAAIGPVSARLTAIESRLTDMDKTIAMLYNQTPGSGSKKHAYSQGLPALTDVHAIIALDGNNTCRYFENYFALRNRPHGPTLDAQKQRITARIGCEVPLI